ncbi:putative transcriptional regulator [Prevotella dentalis DSM 3688]|uniref:Transcriptional regulator n=1 Tax=Prevotella dentalis (strain ATCC 49559 / DSM 3688 / JCM 13448 / NCTC 12043 / ES 2772) TaxID=908937 RepID=F9D7B0_PREDD|nr:helix-turn-helix domain-containing protein [Prevotella dentalis]AGB29728.1 putative transcriptional regulator [Prevotella dentalis DSM 3688]AGB29840.1 putative transcriptional regulator [Prevotella dentalis DSM 3688]EGQ11476.1 transcriptional regulator [Prevotella dentalis DSM 3688]
MKTFSSKEMIERLKMGLELPSDNALAELLGISKTTLSNWKSRNSIDIPLVFSKCEQLSIDWLLTGTGTMFKSTEEGPIIDVKPIHHPRSTEKKEESQVVYLYDFEASAGLKSLFGNNRQNIIDTIKIPNLPKCDGAIHIVGDSMYPLLKSGDIILYKQVSAEIQNIIYGEMYLLSYDIDGEDYIVVKYIRKSDKGEPFVTLASENPEHAARDIDFRRVSAMAIVKASVRINCMV